MDEDIKTRNEKREMLLQNQAKFLKQSGFDSVRIFATVHDSQSETTVSIDAGLGNLQAQYGQIHEWVIRMDQIVIEDAKKDANG